MIPRRRVLIQKEDFTGWIQSIISLNRKNDTAVKRFEETFASYLGSRFAYATVSGREAILACFQAVGVQAGDEILVPGYTLGELMPIFQQQGLKPTPVDVEEDSFNMDVTVLKKQLSNKTKVILATHLLGAPCAIKAIMAEAKSRGIIVIEDCAHALGATVSGKKVGTFGDFGIFSFAVNKPIQTYGGGMVVTNNPVFARRLEKQFSSPSENRLPALKKACFTWAEELLVRSPFYSIMAKILFSEKFATAFEKMYRGSNKKQRSVNASYSAYQARLGLARLKTLDRRKERMLGRIADFTKNIPPEFALQKKEKEGTPSFYNLVVSSSIPPKKVRAEAASLGVDLGIGSEVMDDCGALLKVDTCPISKKLFERSLLIPFYENLSEKKYTKLLKVLKSIASKEAHA